MPRPTFHLTTLPNDCHPETCTHERHYLWWLVSTRPAIRSKGFDSREEAEAYCEAHGYTYQYKERIWY